jgi:hypothetical protein
MRAVDEDWMSTGLVIVSRLAVHLAKHIHTPDA